MEELRQVEWSGEISYAHIVHTDTTSPCFMIHGHNAEIHVMVLGRINKDGMIIDFKKIKNIVSRYDHKFLVPQELVDYDIHENISTIKINDTDSIVLKGRFIASIEDLPIPVATSEYLAETLAKEILSSQDNILMCEVNWNESNHSSATYTAKKGN
jgi:6-pyruvoyl-tetrahydropterin synthase